ACLPPEAMVATKRLLKAAYMSGLSEQRKLEEEAASHLEGSAESKEAFSAFMEKRQPKFAE
ncbi:enoyl-CoA hydratase, partial [Turicibacter sanguinis]|nr:enoyl-CoA hydratase [Turicibacter sanguinis]